MAERHKEKRVSAVDDALDCRLRGEGRGQGTCSISFSHLKI